MNTKPEALNMAGFSAFSRWFTAACIALMALFIWAGVLLRGEYPGRIVLCAALLAALFRLLLKVCRGSRLPSLPLLLGLCLALKLAFVLIFRTEPYSDYYTFWNTAAMLSQGGIDPESYLPEYIAMFPHIFGYASFLSLFYSLFGSTSTLLAAVVNALLSTLSMLCLYDIVLRLASRRAAVAAALLWTVCPSQTIYNIFVLSEPYYTALLLMGLCCALRLEGRGRWLAAAGMGLCFALAETARPVGLLMLVALALHAVFFTGGAGGAVRRLAPIVLAAVIVLGVKSVNEAVIEKELGTAPSGSLGYTMCVGLNTETGGGWNEADSQLLVSLMDASEPFSADEVQAGLMAEAKSRIGELGVGGILQLAVKKLYNLLCGDGVCVEYARGDLPYGNWLKALCNAFWLLLWAAAAFGGLKAAKRGAPTAVWAAAMFPVGLAAAHMLTEVALRYHYSMLPCLVILAACAVKESAETTQAKK